MTSPKVSVVMSVYNGERYLREAVESILNQTFTDFEFIIINDGSTDRTPQILAEFTDPRIKVINQPNRGLAASLNRGIRLAKGEYIARMDADDLSEPERLEKQVEVLNREPDVALVACWYKVIGEGGDVLAYRRLLYDSERLANVLRYKNILCHGSIMMRKSAVEIVGLYNETLRYAQDYELWLRMLQKGFRFSVIPEFLYNYRISPDSVAKLYIQRGYAALIRKAQKGRQGGHFTFRKRITPLTEKRKDSLYHYVIGTLKLEEGEVKGARRELSYSIKMDPVNLNSWYRLALSFLPFWLRTLISNSVRRGMDLLVWLGYRWAR